MTPETLAIGGFASTTIAFHLAAKVDSRFRGNDTYQEMSFQDNHLLSFHIHNLSFQRRLESSQVSPAMKLLNHPKTIAN